MVNINLAIRFKILSDDHLEKISFNVHFLVLNFKSKTRQAGRQ
jgi:hypothetical protein